MSTSDLFDLFRAAFPEVGEPLGACRCPGRINLLGEHLDYNGLPVLPTTIQHEIRVAFSPRHDHRIVLRNVSREFADASFENGPDIPPSVAGSWENYCKAAVQALNDRFPQTGFPGLHLLVDGDIPCAAGLSSSSALVVAFALAYLRVSGLELEKDITRLDLAVLCAEGEHYVGTRGGGMDQAIALCGEPDTACKIDFFPLRVQPVPMFSDCVFVAAHSLVKAEKSSSALHRYNAGPVVCRLLTALVEETAREEYGEEVALNRLGDLWYGPLCLTYEESRELFEKTFIQETWSLAKIAAQLKLSEDEVNTHYLNAFPIPKEGLRLGARARHVLTEYQRVESGRDFLLAGEPVPFGALMDASHESCARDYEVSCPELDELTRVCRASGALGSRMTGAGFGGYTVSLIPEDDIEIFLSRVFQGYYASRGITRDRLRGVLWPLSPSAAAGYM